MVIIKPNLSYHQHKGKAAIQKGKKKVRESGEDNKLSITI